MIVLPMPPGFLPRRIKDMTTLQSPPVTATGTTRRGAHPLYTLLIDMVAPIALFYGIRGFGGSVWLALVAGGAVPAVSARQTALATAAVASLHRTNLMSSSRG